MSAAVQQPGVALVELREISKSFPGTQALSAVDFDVQEGEVHALVGENGAGKSTLMRVLSGFYPDYEGQVRIAGASVHLSSPRQAADLGLALIHQELSLVPEMTVCENIFLGREPGGRAFIDFRAMRRGAEDLLEQFGVRLPVTAKVSRLSAAERQLVEIAKGLSRSPRVLILDEPTSSLSYRETRELFGLIRSLRERGTSIVYISHKLDEVFTVGDRITVLRDGQKVATRAASEWTEDGVVRAMVGRDLSQLFPKSALPREDVLLSVQNLGVEGRFEDVSFEVRCGEIVGLAGLIGAGRSEVAEAIFGLEPADVGVIFVEGYPVKIRTPTDAIRAGIMLVPEDRRLQGLISILSVKHNISLPSLRRLCRLQWIRSKRERIQVGSVASDVGIRTPGLDVEVRTLSGGNQQKVVIAKWLMMSPKILILDEPTRGIDIGAKAEVHALIDKLAGQGAAILLISSELPEILGMSDRVLVMRQGRVVAEFAREQATEEGIMAAASAVTDAERLAG